MYYGAGARAFVRFPASRALSTGAGDICGGAQVETDTNATGRNFYE